MTTISEGLQEVVPWVKTNQTQDATIFSNGRGDDTDIAAQNGTRNKWAGLFQVCYGMICHK